MKEIWDLATSPAMLPLTILLVPVGLYWLLTLIGIAGHGIFHGHGGGHGPGHHSGGGHHHGPHHSGGHHHGHGVHLGHGHDPSHHPHHAEGESHFFSNLLHGALRIVNAEEIPLMGVLSVLIVLLWGCAMLGNYWLNPGSSAWGGTLVIAGAFVSAVIFTRLVLTPLKPLFKFLQDDPEPEAPLIGRTGYVRTAVVDEKYGQVVVDNRGAPIIIGACTGHAGEPIPRNAHVLVVSRDEQSGLYIVRPSH